MSALHSEGALQMSDLPSPLQYHHAASGLGRLVEAIDSEGVGQLPEVRVSPISPVISIPQSERNTIAKALEATGGERGKAARILGIGRTTLYRKMKQYSIG
jgi:two-component system response regulator HydG